MMTKTSPAHGRQRRGLRGYALLLAAVQLSALAAVGSGQQQSRRQRDEPAGGSCVARDCDAGRKWEGPCSRNADSCEVGCLGTWCPVEPSASAPGADGNGALPAVIVDDGVAEIVPLEADGADGAVEGLPSTFVAAEAVDEPSAEEIVVASVETDSTAETEEAAPVLDPASRATTNSSVSVDSVEPQMNAAAINATTMASTQEGEEANEQVAVTDSLIGPDEELLGFLANETVEGTATADGSVPDQEVKSWYCGPKSCAGVAWGGSCASNERACVVGCLGTWCPHMTETPAGANEAAEDTSEPSSSLEARGPLRGRRNTWYCVSDFCSGSIWGGSCATSQTECEDGCYGTWCPPIETPPPDEAPLPEEDTAPADDKDKEPIGWFCGPKACDENLWQGGCSLSKLACEEGCGGSWCPEYEGTFYSQGLAEATSRMQHGESGAQRIHTVFGSRTSPYEQGIVARNGMFGQ